MKNYQIALLLTSLLMLACVPQNRQPQAEKEYIIRGETMGTTFTVKVMIPMAQEKVKSLDSLIKAFLDYRSGCLVMATAVVCSLNPVVISNIVETRRSTGVVFVAGVGCWCWCW